jgi:hypothetical protein
MQGVLRLVMAVYMAMMSVAAPMYSNTRTEAPVSTAPQTVPVYDGNEELLTLAEGGETDYVIIYAESAARAEITAAQELKNYFDEQNGTDIPLLTAESTAPAAKEIVVGKTGRAIDALIDREALGTDGFTIAAQGESVIISGGEVRGTLYGVYSFLETYFGCRWFTPELSVVPELAQALLPATLNDTQTPAFLFRDTSWMCSWNAEWRAKQALNGSLTPWHSPLDETYTDILNFGGGDAGHTFRFFVPEEVYFESHPEYFALGKNGKRMPGQVCLANEDVYQLTLAHVLHWLQENPNAEYISVSQNDNQDYCRCSQCAAIDAREGSPAGSMLTFVNRIARDVKAAGYNDVLIHTFAYQYTRTPPKYIVPEDNVMVMLCSIECNHSEPYQYSDPEFYDDLAGWAAICDRLFIWDYTTDFGHYLTPLPDYNNLQTNIQMFYENNVEGCFMQGNSMSVNGEFGEMRSYLMAKLLWDPYCDIQKHWDEFMYYYYGPGCQNIFAYIDVLAENKSKFYDCFESPEDIVCLSYFDLERCDALWDACEAAATGDAQLARIQRSRLQVQYYKSVARKGEFIIINSYDERVAAGQKLYDDLTRLGITRLRESRDLMENPNFWDKASTWNVKS